MSNIPRDELSEGTPENPNESGSAPVSRRGFLKDMAKMVGGAALGSAGMAYLNSEPAKAADPEPTTVSETNVMAGKPDDIDEETWKSFHPATREYYRDPNSETSKKILAGMPPSYSSFAEGREMWVQMTPEFRNRERLIYNDMEDAGLVDEHGQPTDKIQESLFAQRLWEEGRKQPALQLGALGFEHISKYALGTIGDILAQTPPADLVNIDESALEDLIKANKSLKTKLKAWRTSLVVAGDGVAATGMGVTMASVDVVESVSLISNTFGHLFGGRTKDSGGAAGALLGKLVGNGIGFAIWKKRYNEEDLQNIDLPTIENLEKATEKLEKSLERVQARAEKEAERQEKRLNAQAEAETSETVAGSKERVAEQLRKEALALREANRAKRESAQEEIEAEKIEQERLKKILHGQQTREQLERALLRDRAQTAKAKFAVEEQEASLLKLQKSNSATRQEIAEAEEELERRKRDHQAERLEDEAIATRMEEETSASGEVEGGENDEDNDEGGENDEKNDDLV